jgi:hypothetical protein
MKHKQQQQSIAKITKELVSSTNSEIRENALVSAQLWIEGTHFERMDQKEMEMSFLRLWQGLFYCMYLPCYLMAAIICSYFHSCLDNSILVNRWIRKAIPDGSNYIRDDTIV